MCVFVCGGVFVCFSVCVWECESTIFTPFLSINQVVFVCHCVYGCKYTHLRQDFNYSCLFAIITTDVIFIYLLLVKTCTQAHRDTHAHTRTSPSCTAITVYQFWSLSLFLFSPQYCSISSSDLNKVYFVFFFSFLGSSLSVKCHLSFCFISFPVCLALDQFNFVS